MAKVRRSWFGGLIVPTLLACGACATQDAELGRGTSDALAVTASGAAEIQLTCDDRPFLDGPADKSARGPWAVGVKRATVSGLMVDVWYPAVPGSEVDREKVNYDVREDLPPEQAAKISDADAPKQPCDCVRDLPIDTAHGPYPLVIFIHGTAGFKTQNLDNAVHWASHGFVVMAANHPGLTIASFVGGGGVQDLRGNVEAEIAGITAAAGELAMFAGRVDTARIGLAGHSAGGNGVAGLGNLPGVKVIIPMSSGAATTGASVESSLFVSGGADGLVSLARVADGYASTAARRHKRFVGITGAGHTGVTSLCGIRNREGKSILDVAKASRVLTGPIAFFADTLFDCTKNTTPASELLAIVNEVTTATLQETLQCDASGTTDLQTIASKYSKVEDYRQEP